MKRFIPFLKSDPMVAVLRLNGVIASGGRGQTLNDAGLAPLMEKAFRKGKPKAVALVINSPGGSPVQSSLITYGQKRSILSRFGGQVINDAAASMDDRALWSRFGL